METTAEEISHAVEDRLSGTPCPECGSIDWLASSPENGFIRVRCDDCMEVESTISLAELGLA